MKQKGFFSLFLVCLTLLTGCAGSPSAGTAEELPPKGSTADSGITLVDEPPWFVTCRIVDGAENDTLVLAEQGDGGTGVYTLSTAALGPEALPEEPLRSGQLINVYYGAFTESWPMEFGGVTSIEILEGGFDDRCVLYLDVLEDLWEIDSGLNSGVEVLGVDLSQTSLSPSEQSAVAWTFAESHGANLAEGSLDELTEQGYITATPLSISGSGVDLNEPEHFSYEWKNGCHFSITEQPMEGSYNLTPVTFDAMKWRSSLGAYLFCDCTAVQSALGEWSDYRIGSETIS